MHIINARLPGYEGLQQIAIAPDHTLQSIHPMSHDCPGEHVLDVEGDWVSPGGVDLQINGGLGLAFPDLDRENLEQMMTLSNVCELLWEQGVDAFLPTIVTSSVEDIQRALGAIASAMTDGVNAPQRAQILGVHLEGPFLNPVKRGAHPEAHLLPLTLDQVKRVLGDYASIVKVMTLAPELDEMGDVIPFLRSLGITVSLGHSLATAEQANAAFDQGATMVTHAFNAMPGLHHRKPGLLGAALTHESVFAGFIADGEHVCPTMLDLLLRTSPNLFLVSDALAPLGLPDGVYPWDTRQIKVTQGTARLLDGTLSGTTLPLLDGVKNLVKWGLCEVEVAIALATLAPRRAMGLAAFTPGKTVPLLRWSHATEFQALSWKRLV